MFFSCLSVERFYQQGRLSQDVADAAQDLEKDMENMNPVSVAMTAINTGTAHCKINKSIHKKSFCSPLN